MKLALKGINKLMTATLNTVLIIAVGLLVLDVVWGVFTRYTLGEQAAWTEELAKFLLTWVTLLGGAAAFATKGHLGVAVFCACDLCIRWLVHRVGRFGDRTDHSGVAMENGIRLLGYPDCWLFYGFVYAGKHA